jgi:hypothetical protein
MKSRKYVFRLLGICLLMAIGALSLAAHAFATGDFKILGTALAKGEKTSITGNLEEITLLLIEDLNAEILCEKMDVTGNGTVGNPQILAEGVMHAIFLYLGCTVEKDEAGGQVYPCIVEDGENKEGEISFVMLGLVLLHEGKTFLLVEPRAGSTSFTTIKFVGGPCPLPPSLELKGSAMFEVGSEAADLKFTPLLKPESLFLGDGLKAGTHKAYLKGAMLLLLNEAPHVGCKWGAI